MAAQKNLVLRKQINGILYDLMVRTVSDQVYVESNKTLTVALNEMLDSVNTKASTTDLTDLETRFNALVQNAPEAYDTLKEISDYIATHGTEYDALLAISETKVDKVAGKGLSTNDFTDDLMTKLNAIYDKATMDEKITAIETRLSAVEAATGNPTEITAADVKYETADGVKMTVKSALDELMYVDLSISMSLGVATVQEIGASLSDVKVNWTYNKPSVVSQMMNGVALPDVAQRQYIDAGPITTNKTWTLKANDGTKDFTKSISISFKNRVFYGVSETADASLINSDFIKGLTGNKFADSKNNVGSISVNAAAGQYIYYAQPATFANPIFNIGGFDTTFELFATIDFTNASGHTASYKVFKSSQAGLGSTSMTVK